MKTCSTCVLAALAAALTVNPARAQTPLTVAFTYQGDLEVSGAAADGIYDFRFTLYDAMEDGNQIDQVLVSDVTVAEGLFTVEIEFTDSAAFNLDQRWMAIDVRPDGAILYTPLSPRQNLTAAPYALRAALVENRELTDDVELGDASTAGSLRVFSGASSNPTIQASGSNGQLILGEPSGVSDAKLVINAVGQSAVRIRTDGVTRMMVAADGQVGVHTSTPDAALDVQGSTGAENPLAVRHFGASEPTMRVEADGQTLLGETAGLTDAQLVINATGESALRIRTDGTTRVMVAADGQVGVHTASPDAALDVQSATSTEDALAVRHFGASSPSLIVAADGQVGIQEDAPQANLHVTGATLDAAAAALSNEEVVVEDSDAVVGLYSGGGGNWGSGVVLGQIDTGGNLVNKWAMVRRTSAAGGGLRFTYGTDSNYANNPSMMTLSTEGTLSVPVLSITGADLAERFPMTESAEPGTVVAMDAEQPGRLCVSRGAYNRLVAGVVSGAGDLPAGAILGNLPGHDQAPPIALSGRVWVQCETSAGAIAVGDLLTTSDVSGHAMKVTDFDRAHGAVIGKAMTALAAGERGLVLVLVGLQ